MWYNLRRHFVVRKFPNTLQTWLPWPKANIIGTERMVEVVSIENFEANLNLSSSEVPSISCP